MVDCRRRRDDCKHGAENVPRRKWKAATIAVALTCRMGGWQLECDPTCGCHGEGPNNEPGGAAPPRRCMARACATKTSSGGPQDTCITVECSKVDNVRGTHRASDANTATWLCDDSPMSMQIDESQPATPSHHDGDATTADENLVLAPLSPPLLPSAFPLHRQHSRLKRT